MSRWERPVVITEKIDGTNGQIGIKPTDLDPKSQAVTTVVKPFGQVLVTYEIFAGSRNRWLSPDKGRDNHGFAQWVNDNASELFDILGEGRHFGEWWGAGIQRTYDMRYKRFSLFNTERWANLPFDGHSDSLVLRVPVCYAGPNYPGVMDIEMDRMKVTGSLASHGYPNPEGVVMFHTAANFGFKKTYENDEGGKERQ
jgi:hypothetical protein